MRNIIAEMTDWKYLPLKKEGVTTHYEGSIDKIGGNADWNWSLYQDENGEWVLFECMGAGCILNFVQHRYIASEEPVFKFYFDGEKEPSFEIKPHEFGEKYPFLQPVAGKFITERRTSRPIRVIRSFVPMPFAKSCKVTSTIKLMGNDVPEGGWGHIIYQRYHDNRVVTTFSAEEDAYKSLIRSFKNVGIPQSVCREEKNCAQAVTLKAKEKKTVFCDTEGGLVTAIRCRTNVFDKEMLQDLKMQITFDGHDKPDVDANFGCLFSNEFGYNPTNYLLSGMDSRGGFYCFYPMPYTKQAEIVIVNQGEMDVDFDVVSVTYTREYQQFYEENEFGYFTTSPYYEKKRTYGSDSIIAEVSGSGHIVNSIITGYKTGDGLYELANCEGDARIHFNGIRTPQIESDGSESYACYGWGFAFPPQVNPASGYDGILHHIHTSLPAGWSMTRNLIGDWYPFRNGFRFGIESNGCNQIAIDHSGMVFYYRYNEMKEYEICKIDIGNEASEKEAAYVNYDQIKARPVTSYFEGDDDDIRITMQGRYLEKGSEFTVALKPDTRYVVIRRVSDQTWGRQCAQVFVDGREVTECLWYVADKNGCKRWLEDEFIIPSGYVEGKEKITVSIVPLKLNDSHSLWKYFNEFEYTIYGVLK